MNNFNSKHRSGGSNFGRRDFDRNSNNNRDRQMHQAVCSNCGKNCQVPFMPTGSKPVYCSECFESNNSSSGRFDNRGSDRPRFNQSFSPNKERAPQPQNNFQLDAINEKLDKILRLLSTPKNETPPTPVKSAQKKAKIAKKKVSSKKNSK